MEAIRRLDSLNRICVPRRMRTMLDITPGTRLTVTVRDHEIHIKKAAADDPITSYIDSLGRNHISRDIIAALGIVARAHIRIACTGDEIILCPVMPRCKLCGSEGDLLEYKEGLYVCRDCLDHLKSL